MGVLNTISEEHRTASIKHCVDGSGALKGIQVTAGILGSPSTDLIPLTIFGNVAGSGCTTQKMRIGEYVNEF